MKSKYLFNFIIISLLYSKIQQKDNCTLSNYEEITITYLTGIFEPDFNQKIVKGSLTFTFHSKIRGEKIILDKKNLEINSVINTETNYKYNYRDGKEDKNYGTPLIIDCSYEKNENITVTINYTTTTDGSSAQFLNKEQTEGKTHEYFFTMSALINGRQLLPSQDTPAVKFPFYLGIRVKKDLLGMISGLFDKEEIDDDNNTKIYYYNQSIPVPNYLIALAAGNIIEKKISDDISVYTEPEFMTNVANELNDFPYIFSLAKNYMGPYEWAKYNILVLPRSFPYSGMENPCLSFCSPCLINGDKSLVDIIVHELIHSWSGNLVTNENWSDFWLNEGITMFLQRKIVGMWKGDPNYSKMDARLGLLYINEYINIFGENSTYTTLRPNLTGVSPDDVFSDIPYEKGYNFIYYIESLIGEEAMKTFFQNYFQHFKYKSIDFYDFKNYFIDFCLNNNITNETLNLIKWDEWIFKPGKCPENNFTTKYSVELDETYNKFIRGEIDENLENIFNNWSHTSKTIFMIQLKQRKEFLTERQHDFFTKKLKLYQGQNFLVTTNYFRLILAKTDKFYENEKEYLIKYLSNYGAKDYMVGIYESFYKRDEIEALNIFNNLRSFYHILMVKMIEEEFQKAKEYFPIMEINLKNNDQCLFLSNETRIEITTKEYKDFLGKTEITDGIYLEFNNSNIKLNCILDINEKYCLIKNKTENYAAYHLNIPERIQKPNYAVKIHKGNETIKAYGKDIKLKKPKNIYELNCGDYEQKIEITFLNEPDKI